MATLLLPKQLNYRSLVSEIGLSVGGCTNVTGIDFARLEWVNCSGMAALATLVKRMQETFNVEINWLNAETSKAFPYLQDMDFFSHFSVFPNESFDRINENRAFARMIQVDWEGDSSQIAKNLSKLVSKHGKTFYNDFFTCIEESVRNVIDHAQKPGYAVAQSRKEGGGDRSYNIAICDYGRGIADALADNPAHQGLDHRTALEVACLKGTSSRSDKPDKNGFQVNFGVGLYQIDQISKATNGRFIISSGDTVRIRDAWGVRYEPIPDWQGTSIEVSLFLSGFRDILNKSSSPKYLRFG